MGERARAAKSGAACARMAKGNETSTRPLEPGPDLACLLTGSAASRPAACMLGKQARMSYVVTRDRLRP